MNDYYNVNQWEGKTVCFLGDSITDGVGVGAGERYFDLMDGMIGIKSVGYGVNGAQFINLIDQINRMKKDNVKPHAIFVFAGTNDYNGSRPLGNWYDISDAEVITRKDAEGNVVSSETRPRRSFSFDRSTFRGCINIVMSELRHSYPRADIVLMTPIHRGFAEFGPDNIQFPEDYPNHLGFYIDDYVSVVKEAAGIWAAELIDLHSVSGLFPCFNESADMFANTVRDRLHPGKKGHERMAEVIARKMVAIAPGAAE